MGKHQGKVLRKEFHASSDLFEELTEFLQADNKNFSYSIFLDAFNDATEDYLREQEAEEVFRKIEEQKKNTTTSITI